MSQRPNKCMTHKNKYMQHITKKNYTCLVAAVEGAGLARHGLDEHADGHAGGEGVLWRFFADMYIAV